MPNEHEASVEQARRGNRAAMERLFEAYRNMVFAVGLSICGNATDADEIVQESFLRAFRRLGEFRGDSKFSSWLYVIANRVALDWQKRFRRRPRTEPAGTAELNPGRGEEIQRLLEAMKTLPLQQRLVITLRHYRALSIRETAEAMDIAEGTVKAQLHFAVARLREILAPDLKK